MAGWVAASALVSVKGLMQRVRGLRVGGGGGQWNDRQVFWSDVGLMIVVTLSRRHALLYVTEAIHKQARNLTRLPKSACKQSQSVPNIAQKQEWCYQAETTR